MAPRPTHLIVRLPRSKAFVYYPTSTIPEEICPENWYDNPYWLHNPDLKDVRPLIEDYLRNQDIPLEGVRRLANYFVDYACHIAIAAYIFGGGEATLVFNVDVIKRLRALARSASTLEDLRTMIDVGMEYALDPI